MAKTVKVKASTRKGRVVKAHFRTIAKGTKVSYHYRSAIGHGTVTGVKSLGTNADNTRYSIKQTDHHPGEPAIVIHTGKALKK